MDKKEDTSSSKKGDPDEKDDDKPLESSNNNSSSSKTSGSSSSSLSSGNSEDLSGKSESKYDTDVDADDLENGKADNGSVSDEFDSFVADSANRNAHHVVPTPLRTLKAGVPAIASLSASGDARTTITTLLPLTN